MKLVIHQPETFPYLGYFEKVRAADILVILDHVQFKKNNYQNRNQIRIKGGATWLTIPVKKHSLDTRIADIQINHSVDWQLKWNNLLLQNYKFLATEPKHLNSINDIIYNRELTLSQMNFKLISYLWTELGYTDTPLIGFSSEMQLAPELKGSAMLVEICKQFNADEYISGEGGKNYLDLRAFKDAGIQVTFKKFEPKPYKQQYEPFLPYMSALDYILNLTKK